MFEFDLMNVSWEKLIIILMFSSVQEIYLASTTLQIIKKCNKGWVALNYSLDILRTITNLYDHFQWMWPIFRWTYSQGFNCFTPTWQNIHLYFFLINERNSLDLYAKCFVSLNENYSKHIPPAKHMIYVYVSICVYNICALNHSIVL